MRLYMQAVPLQGSTKKHWLAGQHHLVRPQHQYSLLRIFTLVHTTPLHADHDPMARLGMAVQS